MMETFKLELFSSYSTKIKCWGLFNQAELPEQQANDKTESTQQALAPEQKLAGPM
jgi:hypothetical protein